MSHDAYTWARKQRGLKPISKLLLREICDRYDVLLVSDEVICAFGRIGSMFACSDFGYVPDIITCASGTQATISPDV